MPEPLQIRLAERERRTTWSHESLDALESVQSISRSRAEREHADGVRRAIWLGFAILMPSLLILGVTTIGWASTAIILLVIALLIVHDQDQPNRQTREAQ